MNGAKTIGSISRGRPSTERPFSDSAQGGLAPAPGYCGRFQRSVKRNGHPRTGATWSGDWWRAPGGTPPAHGPAGSSRRCRSDSAHRHAPESHPGASSAHPNESGGGARAGRGTGTSAGTPRCRRIRSITVTWSMSAMRRNRPPHRGARQEIDAKRALHQRRPARPACPARRLIPRVPVTVRRRGDRAQRGLTGRIAAPVPHHLRPPGRPGPQHAVVQQQVDARRRHQHRQPPQGTPTGRTPPPSSRRATAGRRSSRTCPSSVRWSRSEVMGGRSASRHTRSSRARCPAGNAKITLTDPGNRLVTEPDEGESAGAAPPPRPRCA